MWLGSPHSKLHPLPPLPPATPSCLPLAALRPGAPQALKVRALANLNELLRSDEQQLLALQAEASEASTGWEGGRGGGREGASERARRGAARLSACRQAAPAASLQAGRLGAAQHSPPYCSPLWPVQQSPPCCSTLPSQDVQAKGGKPAKKLKKVAGGAVPAQNGTGDSLSLSSGILQVPRHPLLPCCGCRPLL